MRKILAYILYGIGHFAWLVYQKTMNWSSDVQGESDNGPWNASNR